jgi:hypothetical protein
LVVPGLIEQVATFDAMIELGHVSRFLRSLRANELLLVEVVLIVNAGDMVGRQQRYVLRVGDVEDAAEARWTVEMLVGQDRDRRERSGVVRGHNGVGAWATAFPR